MREMTTHFLLKIFAQFFNEKVYKKKIDMDQRKQYTHMHMLDSSVKLMASLLF